MRVSSSHRFKWDLAIVRLTYLILLLFTPGLIAGQIIPESSIVKFEVGYLNGKGEESSFTVEGVSFGASFERISRGGQTGMGLMIAYFSVDDNIVQSNGSIQNVQFTSLPVFAIFNYYFTTSKLIPYAGLGIGFHVSNGESAFNSYQTDRGMAISLPAGIKWFAINNLALDANYRFNYLGSSYLGDGLAHTLNAGIVYNFW